MSILKYLDNPENNVGVNENNFNYDYNNVVSSLYKKELIDLSCYTILNNFAKYPNIINLKWIIEIMNKIKKINENEKKIIKNTFDKILNLDNNKLVLNKELFNNLIDNKYINFSTNQEQALKILIEFIVDHNQKTFGLYGYAGTGKTTTLVEFIAYLIENKFIKSVALSAPTNKAVNIIKSKFRYHLKRLSNVTSDNYTFDDLIDILEKKKGIKIDFLTIHKLLNYKNDFDIEGDRVFLRGDKTNLDGYDLVIIDE